jgi:serine/threonine-protein kinase
MLVPLMALLLGAGIAALVLQALTPSAPPETTAATVEVTGSASATPEELVLAREEYLGRPVDAVRAQLEAMGLVVQLEEVTTRSADPDTVVDVAPLSARLQTGQTVLVSYAVAPRSSSRASSSAPRGPSVAVVAPSEHATPSATPTPTVAVSPTPTVTTPSSVAATTTPPSVVPDPTPDQDAEPTGSGGSTPSSGGSTASSGSSSSSSGSSPPVTPTR